MKNGCKLCDIESGVLDRGPLWTMVLNENQTLLGRSYLALNRHETDVAHLTDAEETELFDGFRRAKAALDRLLQPDHYNYVLLMNVVPHVHGHIIPRFAGTREFAGLTFADEQFGGHYDPNAETILDGDAFNQLRAAIIDALRDTGR